MHYISTSNMLGCTGASFPFKALPSFLTHLLTIDSASPDRVGKKLDRSIKSFPFERELLDNIFRELPKGARIPSKIIQAVGWMSFRNKLAVAYLHKLKNERFHFDLDDHLIQDLLIIESKYEKFFAFGNSRFFLFLIYLKTLQLTTDYVLETGPDSTLLSLHKMLEGRPFKSNYLDVLILELWLYKEYLTSEQLSNLLVSEDRDKYDALFSLLPPISKEEFGVNLVNYLSSINEPEIMYV